ncbi:unnamed protein product, partial [Heterotrigona itama]
MSTTDPTGEGGGGGVTSTISPNIEQNVSPVIPVTGSVVQPGSQQQHPPPSPLSGCYLLVVLPEPHTAQHKDLILNRLAKGKRDLIKALIIEKSVLVSLMRYAHVRPTYSHIPAVTRAWINNPSTQYITKIVAKL